jgi:hypothetical protein
LDEGRFIKDVDEQLKRHDRQAGGDCVETRQQYVSGIFRQFGQIPG